MRFCRYATDHATREVRFFWGAIFLVGATHAASACGALIFPYVGRLVPHPAHPFRAEAFPLRHPASFRDLRLPRYSAYVPLYILWKNDNSLSSRAQGGICFSPKPNDRLRSSKRR